MKKRAAALALCLTIFMVALAGCAGQQAEAPAAQGAQTYADFTGGDKLIAVQTGDIYEDFVRGQGWCAEPLLYQDFNDIAQAVRLGRADAAMMTEDAVPALIESGAFDDLEFLPVPLEVLEVRSAPIFGDDALAQQFNTFLAQLAADGILDEMNARYLNGIPDYDDIPKIELSGGNGILKAADTGNYPPMSYVGEGGEVLGYDTELTQRFAQYLGMDLQLDLMAYDAVLPSVVGGSSDMSACFYVITDEREAGVRFGDPVMRLGSVLAVKKQAGTADSTVTYEDFKGKRFSILVGSLFDEVADRVFNASEKLYFNNTVEEIEAVKLGKTDAALMDDVAAAQALQAGEYGDLTALEVPLEELDLEYGVFSTRQDIINQYNQFLAEIEADGTLAEMQQRWLKSYAFDAVMPDIPLNGENGTLTVAIMATYPPFTFAAEGGEFSGFDIEQMRRFAAWLGMDVKFVDMDFGAMLAYVSSDKADIGGSVYATAERKESFIFGNPDYVSSTVLVVRAQGGTARDYTWLSGRQVGIPIGYSVDAVLEDLGVIPAYYQETVTGVEDVRNGRIEGFISDLSITRVLAGEAGNEGMEVIEIPASYFTAPMGAVVKPGNQALADEFNAFLAGIQAEGTLAEMQDRWFEGVPDLDAPMPQLTYTGEKGILRVATCGTNIPFDYIGAREELKGYSIELMNRFAAQAGYTVEYQTMEFTALLPAVTGGRADMAISCISITEERKESVLFTDSIYDDRLGAIVLKENVAGNSDSTGGSFISWLKTAVQRNLIEESRWKMIVNGLGVTMGISLLAQVLGTVLGCLLCWVLMRKTRFVRGLGQLYSGLIHGLPMVVLLMISYYIIFGKTDVPAMLIAVCAFALVEAAAVAANLKGAIATVDPIEIEAARSMGFTAFGAFRAVTLPQAVKRALPAYCNGFIELVKATAIVGYIAIQDMTRAGDIIRSRTYDAYFPLLLVAVIYLLVTTLCVQLFKLIVKKVTKEVR